MGFQLVCLTDLKVERKQDNRNAVKLDCHSVHDMVFTEHFVGTKSLPVWGTCSTSLLRGSVWKLFWWDVRVAVDIRHSMYAGKGFSKHSFNRGEGCLSDNPGVWIPFRTHGIKREALHLFQMQNKHGRGCCLPPSPDLQRLPLWCFSPPIIEKPYKM